MKTFSFVLVSTATANVDPVNTIYFTDTSANSVDLTLPLIDAEGMTFIFRNIDTIPTINTTTITAAGGNTIENAPSLLLPTGTFMHFVALGTNWLRVA